MMGFKKVAIWLLLIFTAINILYLLKSLNLINKYQEGQKQWELKYKSLVFSHDSLATAHDTLVASYSILIQEQKTIDSIYSKSLKDNQSEYEKVIDKYSTLTLDEHILQLSKFLSEKDSIRK